MGLRHGLPAIAAVLLAAACATRPIDLPASFVELQDAGQGLRAMTSDDARLWHRAMYDRTDADVAFWAESLENDLLERGYEVVGEADVESRDGARGRLLECTANVGGERVGYLVAVWARRPSPFAFWLDGTWLQIVEFAAAQEAYDAHVGAVRAALGTVRW